MPTTDPASVSFFSVSFLSAVNPFLLQAEIAAAVLLGIGIVFESERYPTSVHKSAFWFVVIGVILETVFSILLFASEEIETRIVNTTAAAANERAANLETQTAPLRAAAASAEKDVAEANETAAKFKKDAAEIQERAAKAETEAANLMKENIELERAISPRDLDQMDLARAIKDFPRTPIFITSVDLQEPKELASYLYLSFSGISFNGSATWQVTRLPPQWPLTHGIEIEYISHPSVKDSSNEKLAEAICEDLKKQEIDSISIDTFGDDWPSNVPKDGVILKVGAKEDHFWINKYLEKKGETPIPIPETFCTGEEFFKARGREFPKP